MTPLQKQRAAQAFAKRWLGHGYEKGETQKFWIDLLTNVFGVDDIAQFIFFEEQVQDRIQNKTVTNFIDAYIPSTRVMIEQKSGSKDLREPIRQSDGRTLTPFQQAKKYVADLPLSQHPKWIVTCNFGEFLVYDMENPAGEPEQILLSDFGKDYYRLQFLVDSRSENIRREEEVSLKAGELVGKLYDALIKEYINPDANSLRSLNILCVRIVFCLYAEDAGLFETKTCFEDYIKSFNLPSLRKALIDLFKGLDTKPENRDKYDTALKPFPYVNGGLFRDEQIEIPNFTQEIVDVIVNHCAPFNWSEISPTIFGAVFESTLNPDTRRKGGMHYTSIQNIHKVIDPLFMDELNAEFEAVCKTPGIKARKERLLAFQRKLGSLTFLDPACGSGNFLTETYLSLRRLENRVISLLNKGEKVIGFDEFICVKISQFYGIEINDFAVTVAKTALWIAESQMTQETENILSRTIDFLPLSNHANIVEGNALRMDWGTLAEEEHAGLLYTDKLNVYKTDDDFDTPFIVQEPEVVYGKHYKELNVVAKTVEQKELPKHTPRRVTYDYIMGNPPFVGARWMDKRQKEDVMLTFGKDWQGVGDLDYVCCWYKKALTTISDTNTRCAFVSTNSITQGGSVANLWKTLFADGLHIDFAWRTFKWSNETTDKGNMAAVHCVVIGFSTAENNKTKVIFIDEQSEIEAKNINGYLLDMPNVFIVNRKKTLCAVSEMVFGSMANDGRNLLIEADEYDDFIKNDPASKKYIRPFIGAEEFINGKERYCLWLVDATPAELRKMPLVAQRVGAVRKLRESSSRGATRKLAETPWLFGEIRQPQSGNYLLVPRVSSENRCYIPIGFLNADIIASDATLIVPDATLYDFGVMTSSIHMAWMRAVCGRLESRYRYSKDVVYNNFPWCSPTNEQRIAIEKTAQAILDARSQFPESSLADLYDETFMPPALRRAHRENDKAVMAAYGFRQSMSESEIVAELFRLYQELADTTKKC